MYKSHSIHTILKNCEKIASAHRFVKKILIISMTVANPKILEENKKRACKISCVFLQAEKTRKNKTRFPPSPAECAVPGEGKDGVHNSCISLHARGKHAKDLCERIHAKFYARVDASVLNAARGAAD